HGANAYLLDQFVKDGSNHRSDAYGGPIQNRARLPLEVAKAVVGVWGPKRVGYRIAPYASMYSVSDSNPVETFSYLTRELNALELAYLHVVEAIAGPMAQPAETSRITPVLRNKFNSALMVNGGYDADSGNDVIARGEADLVSFGVSFLANPDLPERLRENAPLNAPDFDTFYTGEEKGYIDYPVLA
ncbi:hypothetical protein LCGC14_2942340, partial [marine sediment metagenome]